MNNYKIYKKLHNLYKFYYIFSRKYLYLLLLNLPSKMLHTEDNNITTGLKEQSFTEYM